MFATPMHACPAMFSDYFYDPYVEARRYEVMRRQRAWPQDPYSSYAFK